MNGLETNEANRRCMWRVLSIRHTEKATCAKRSVDIFRIARLPKQASRPHVALGCSTRRDDYLGL